LSLAPSCQRGWGSLYDALNAGTVDLKQLERLIASYPLATEAPWYAVDASVWPRCDAETSPARGYYAHPYRHCHGQPIVAGWNFLAGPVAHSLLELDGSTAGAPTDSRREHQYGGRRADPLLATASATHGSRCGRPDLQLRRRLRFAAVACGLGGR